MKRFLLVALCLAVSPLYTEAAPQRTRIGWVENVGLDDAAIFVKARMDTGAGMSSVDAKILSIKPSAGKGKPERVVYRIHSGNTSETLESDIVEWQNIKKKDAAGFMRRPVVKLGICIGKKKITGRVNLADRTNFLYPVLVGRNFLRTGDYVVDSQKTFTREPRCSSNKPK